MDGSDDYFSDDLILDDQTLAALDQEEAKYFPQTVPTVSPPTTPPAKRLKVTHEHKPARGPWLSIVDDFDELPEISVYGDGLYTLGAIHDHTSDWENKNVKDPSSAKARNDYRQHQEEATAFTSVSSARVPAISTSSVSNDRWATQATLSEGQPMAISMRRDDRPALEAQLAKLRSQMKELQEQNAKAQAALAEALEVKLAKEGEVTILRGSIDKTAKEHAQQLAQLKAAKSEAEAKQAQIQKEMRDDIERMKTQLIFKQHELETSVLKAPSSARFKRFSKETPATPKQISLYESQPDDANPLVQRTPRKMVHDTTHDLDVQRSWRQITVETPRRSAILPGFENSFLPTSSPVRVSKKGKQRAVENVEESINNGHSAATINYVHDSNDTRTLSPLQGPKYAGTSDHDLVNAIPVMDGLHQLVEDVEMAEDMDAPAEELLDDVEPIDWEAQLLRIISTHTLSTSHHSTLQVLMRVDSPTLKIPLPGAYLSTCDKIIKTFGRNAQPRPPFEDTAHEVAGALAAIASMLHAVDCILPLTAVLNLLSVLCYSIPRFNSILLRVEEDNEASWILSTLFKSISAHLDPTKHTEHRDILAKEIVGLLESLCWCIADRDEQRLAAIASSSNILSLLLDESLDDQILLRSVRFLIILASYVSLFRPLLSLPDNETEPETGRGGKRAYIDRLCLYLFDKGRQAGDADKLKDLIVRFFATLSISHSGAPRLLITSSMLLPALVVYLSQLTIPLWEEEETFIATPSLAKACVLRLGDALFLLQHLVLSDDTPPEILPTLQLLPSRYSSGIVHTYIVTLGRLSYADPPEWLDRSLASDLEQLSDVARELLDLFVDGPEGDSIWEVYQDDSIQDADEGELEAELLRIISD